MNESFRPSLHEQERGSEEGLVLRTERLLEKVDFKLLRDIFTEERHKSGLGAENTNLQDLNRIELRPIEYEEEGVAHYTQKLNKIVADVEKIQKLNPTENFENTFFGFLCHEETHSVSTNPNGHSDVFTFPRFIANRPIEKSGVGYVTLGDGEAFHMLNEAITDSLAEEVYDEYFKRSGARTSITNSSEVHSYPRNYPNERNILQAFISALSRATEMSEDVIWSGIKQSYLSNANLAESELVKLYEEVLGANISSIVRNPTESHGVSRNAIRKLNAIGLDDANAFSSTVSKSIERMSWSDALIKRATDTFRKLIRSKRTTGV